MAFISGIEERIGSFN